MKLSSMIRIRKEEENEKKKTAKGKSTMKEQASFVRVMPPKESDHNIQQS